MPNTFSCGVDESLAKDLDECMEVTINYLVDSATHIIG